MVVTMGAVGHHVGEIETLVYFCKAEGIHATCIVDAQQCYLKNLEKKQVVGTQYSMGTFKDNPTHCLSNDVTKINPYVYSTIL